MIVADWRPSEMFCDIPLLNWKFCDLKAASQTCYRGMHADGFLELSPFSPEGLSGFSISVELEDRVFLQLIRKPVERVEEAEVRVSVNPLQESC